MSKKGLTWFRITSDRHQPCGREGHTLVAFTENAYMFGGNENGSRGNSVERFHAPSLTWSKEPYVGTPPSPRSYHSSCQYEEFMIIHGGEGIYDDRSDTNDVCLNDPMGSSRKHFKVMTARQDGPLVRCLDDMHVYNTLNHQWRNVKSSLSPLPRKGHTICVGKVRNVETHVKEKEELLILFGGYSTSSNLMSNSLHICPVAEIIGFMNSLFVK